MCGVSVEARLERDGGLGAHRYLEMLDRLIREVRAEGKAPAEAAAAEAYIKATLVPIDLEKRETANLKPEEFDTFKRTLARHIITLKKALGE